VVAEADSPPRWGIGVLVRVIRHVAAAVLGAALLVPLQVGAAHAEGVAYSGVAAGSYDVQAGVFGSTVLNLTIVLTSSPQNSESSTQAYSCGWVRSPGFPLRCDALGVPQLPTNIINLPPSFSVAQPALDVAMTFTPWVDPLVLPVSPGGPIQQNNAAGVGTWSLVGATDFLGYTLSCVGAAAGSAGYTYAPYGGSVYVENDKLAGSCSVHP
jgi:hypothetical protein